MGRRSVRAFGTRPVPRELIERAIAAAGWAPSPHGSQPWRFVVVEAAARRYALAEAMSDTWRTQLALDGQDEAVIARRLARSRERLERAPVLVLACLYLRELQVYPDPARQRAEEIMAIQSLGAAVQNFLLAIYQSGLDSGWMCAPLFCPEIIRETLDLPGDLHPHALLPVGYAAADPKRRPRRPLDELIFAWDKDLARDIHGPDIQPSEQRPGDHGAGMPARRVREDDIKCRPAEHSETPSH